ncbi:hypothetical protein BDK51DRAFT_30689 [Blyttiomyces helicus]|uniref:Uncharacterized protein n=1 Tax=Blyttiomyces helicus TaxID=388810 RepID=A0A4P9W0U6_9FUNG|nr:hypothetical protein BDK51DRAFT_30689 [Blyttiomyces helicus]|eukprot:RKO85769.1 hypothetical protein BDK51DRAFT_30689 [Blyttiomyces helicus]
MKDGWSSGDFGAFCPPRLLPLSATFLPPLIYTESNYFRNTESKCAARGTVLSVDKRSEPRGCEKERKDYEFEGRGDASGNRSDSLDLDASALLLVAGDDVEDSMEELAKRRSLAANAAGGSSDQWISTLADDDAVAGGAPVPWMAAGLADDDDDLRGKRFFECGSGGNGEEERDGGLDFGDGDDSDSGRLAGVGLEEDEDDDEDGLSPIDDDDETLVKMRGMLGRLQDIRSRAVGGV